MRDLASDVRRRVRMDNLRDAFGEAYEGRQQVHTASVVSKNLISIGGQNYDAAVDLPVGSRVEVVNIGRAGEAVYAPRTGGGGFLLGGGGGGGGGGEGGDGLTTEEVLALVDSERGLAVVSGMIGVNLAAAGTGTGGLRFDGGGAINIDLATDSGLALGATGISIGTPSQIAHNSAAGVSGAGHVHSVAASADVGTTPAASLLKSDGSGKLILATLELKGSLIFSGADRSITSGSGVDVTIDLGGDLILDDDDTFRSSDYADGIPITGFSFHINSLDNRQLTINTIKTDEFHTRLFVADAVRIDIGEEYWGKSQGIVHDAWATPGSIGGTVVVWFEDSPLFAGALFSDHDWLLFRYLDDSSGFAFGSIWGQVTGYYDAGNDAEGRGYQGWTFTLRHGPTGQSVGKGNIAVDMGQSGQGYIHLSTLATADGPWFRIGEWNGANPYTPGNNTIGTQIGLLDGISDADLNPGGYGLYSDNAYLKGAIRTAETMMSDDGLLIQQQYIGDLGFSGHAHIAWMSDINSPEDTPIFEIGSYTQTEVDFDLAWIYVRKQTGSADAALNIGVSGRSEARFNYDGTISLFSTNSLIDVDGDLIPRYDLTRDLGSASLRWGSVYANQMFISGSISGSTLSGAEWQFSGSMIVDANGASDTTVSVTNQGAGRADLAVDRNITLGGTIDGVDLAALDGDVSALSGSYVSHIANAAAHHALVTAGNTAITVAGQAVSVNLSVSSPGLTISSGLAVDSSVVRTSRVLTAGDGIDGGGDLSANLSFAVDSSVVRTSRVLTAGNGLTDGGDLSADRTFNVGAGTGITVNANDVALAASVAGAGMTHTSGVLNVIAGDTSLTVAADSVVVRLATNSGLSVSSGLLIDSSFGGAGLLITSGVLNVVAADGSLTVGTNNMNVNLAHTFSWSAEHTFGADIQLNANLDFLGAHTITTNSTNNLTISPGGDLVLNPGGSDVLPGGSALIDLGDYNRMWRTIHAAELYVENLVASDVMATIGGRVMVAPTTSLIADMTNVQTTIDVKHNGVLFNGCFLIMQSVSNGTPQFEAMKVTSTSSVVTGGFRYTVTRSVDAGTAKVWVVGDAVVNTGSAVGNGYIQLASVDTLHTHIGPTMTVYSRSATTNWNDVKAVVSIGNLESFVDYSASEFGLAIGNDLTLDAATGFSGLTADRTNGLRLFNTQLQWIDVDDDVWSISTDGVAGVYFKYNGADALRLAQNQAVFTGQVFAGDGIQAVGSIYVGSGGLDFTLGFGMNAIMRGNAVDGVAISSGGISHTDHPNSFRSRQWTIAGNRISGNQLNLIAFDLGSFNGATVHFTYSQYNTGFGPDELYVGQGSATVIRDNTSTFTVKTSQMINASSHVICNIDTSGGRAMIYLTRASGSTFRNNTDLRVAKVEVIGNVSNITLSPATI